MIINYYAKSRIISIIDKKVKGIWFNHDLNLGLNEIYYDTKCCNMKHNKK